MEQYLYSEKNIKSQTNQLIRHVQIPKQDLNREMYDKLQLITINSLRTTFKKYNQPEIRGRYDTNDFIEKINKKALSNTVKIVRVQQQQHEQMMKSQPQPKYGVNSGVNPALFNNPNERFATQKETPSRELAPAISDGGGWGTWNSNETNQFQSATGEYRQAPLAISEGVQQTNNLDKKSSYEQEISQRFAHLRDDFNSAMRPPNQPTQENPYGSYSKAEVDAWLGLNRDDNRNGGNNQQQMNQQQGGNNYNPNQFNNGQQQNGGGGYGVNNYTPNQFNNGQQQGGGYNQQNNNGYNQQQGGGQPQQPAMGQQHSNGFDSSFNPSADCSGNDIGSAFMDPKLKQNQNNTYDDSTQSFDRNYQPLQEQSKTQYENIDWKKFGQEKLGALREELKIPAGNFNPMQSPNADPSQQQGNNFFFPNNRQ